MTPQEAIVMSETKWWTHLDERAVAEFQLQEPLLCMPFSEFHRCVEVAAKRPVFTHEFTTAGAAQLLKEIRGESPARSLEEIISLIPEEKRVLYIAAPRARGAPR